MIGLGCNPMLNECFDWLASHKDGVISLAALISPLMALVAAMVSFRAVVTGPKIQLQIAQQQFNLNERQLTIQSKAVELQGKQISANLMGAYDQKWISEFRDTMAEAIATLGQFRLQKGVQRQMEMSGQEFNMDAYIGVQTKSDILIQRVKFLLEDDYTIHSDLFMKLMELSLVDRPDVNYSAKESEIHTMAIAIIRERRNRIAAYMSPVGS
jgi:hypothetical protein